MWSVTLVLELGDVAGTVRCLQQVRLCAAPKWTQVLDGGDASVHKHLLGFGWVSVGVGVEAVRGLSQQLPQLRRKWSGITYVFPDDVNAAQRLFEATIRGDTNPFHFKLRRSDGSAVWVDVQGTPMHNAAGYLREL